LKGVKARKQREEIVDVNRVNLRIQVRFQNGYMLELNEAILVKSRKKPHRIHICWTRVLWGWGGNRDPINLDRTLNNPMWSSTIYHWLKESIT